MQPPLIKQKGQSFQKKSSKSEPSETRSQTMTEKGFEFRLAVKENSARAANKSFHANRSTIINIRPNRYTACNIISIFSH